MAPPASEQGSPSEDENKNEEDAGCAHQVHFDTPTGTTRTTIGSWGGVGCGQEEAHPRHHPRFGRPPMPFSLTANAHGRAKVTLPGLVCASFWRTRDTMAII